MDIKTGDPLWIEWRIADQGTQGNYSVSDEYYFHGKNIIHIFPRGDGHLGYEIIFHETNGDAQTWFDHGHGFFTDRLFYINNDFSRMEVWCDQAWQRVVIRDGVKGLVANGEWRPLYFTNGMWTLNPATTSITNYFK